MKNIWKELPKPMLVQAPMEHVTDTVFRRILAKAGRPDVFFTEFTNVDGLCSPGADEVAKRLDFTELEKPIIAQIWGKTPENYLESTRRIVKMGFDGVDINMGCPDRTVVRNGCCSALIKNHSKAKEIIKAVQEGSAGKIPVSVKTRIGFSEIQTEEWISFLLDQDLDALTVHLRTVKEQSLVPAHWDEMKTIVKLRDAKQKETIIIGNGDILSHEEADEKVQKYGCDGIMIGRGIFQNLWIFNRKMDPLSVTKESKLQYLKEHIELYDKEYHHTRDFNILKKFYKIYVSGWENASDIRAALMEFDNAADTLEYLHSLTE